MIRQHTQHGMTLVELIMAIGVYMVLLLVISNSVVALYRSNSYALEQAAEVDNARRGVTAWNRDAKEMTIAEDGTWPVATIEADRFGYYSDTDRDDSVEYVEYVLASTTLMKHTYNPSGTPATYDLSTPDTTEVLSEYVQNTGQSVATFSYFDNAGAALASTSPLIDVRYITMRLIINIDPVKNPGEFMLTSSLAPRNLKDNL